MSFDIRKWSINPACRLHWRHWDDRYLLFNAASGQTHLLTEMGANVLFALQERALTNTDLEAAIATPDSVSQADETFRQQLVATLEEMYSLGLIKPLSM